MYNSADDLKAFYASKMGRVVRRVLHKHISVIWPSVRGENVVGYGYALPYLQKFIEGEADRVIALMPAGQGAHHWPTGPHEINRVCLCEEVALPLESNSVDKVLMVHGLECAEHLQPHLQEIWRVLKSTGRLIVIVPNRNGLWARADQTPFGQGAPYSAGQISTLLKGNKFIHEQTQEALFMPPCRFDFCMKSANLFEEMGKTFLPIVSGVHIVEASKQLYAKVKPDGGSKLPVRGSALFPRPAASPRTR